MYNDSPPLFGMTAVKEITDILMTQAAKGRRTPAWNRCDRCGRFIGLNEFVAGTAVRVLLTPDSHYSKETYDTFHMQCR